VAYNQAGEIVSTVGTKSSAVVQKDDALVEQKKVELSTIMELR